MEQKQILHIMLTGEEAQVLVNLLDVAVKAAGMQAAESCLHFTKKINQAAQNAAQSMQAAKQGPTPVPKKEAKPEPATAVEEGIEPEPAVEEMPVAKNKK